MMRFQKAKCVHCGAFLEACACKRRACLDLADEEALAFIDGHDDAILGLAEVDGEPRVVYDKAAIVRKLMRRDGMDGEGAAEFVEYNVMGAKPSSAPPLFLVFVR